MKLVWENGQVQQKRELLQKLQSNFVWNEQNLNVFNAKWINTIIKYLPRVEEEINKIEQAKSLVKQGDLADFRETFPSVCGWRESSTCKISLRSFSRRPRLACSGLRFGSSIEHGSAFRFSTNSPQDCSPPLQIKEK